MQVMFDGLNCELPNKETLQLKNGKGSGQGVIINEFLNELKIPPLVSLYNAHIRTGVFPESERCIRKGQCAMKVD